MRFLGVLLLVLGFAGPLGGEGKKDSWFELIGNINKQTGIAPAGTYQTAFRFYFLPSFLPVELYQVYLVEKQWYVSHTTIRTRSNNTLFNDDPEKRAIEAMSTVFLIDPAAFDRFFDILERNSFLSFHGDESETKGLDGQTLYFESFLESKETFFHYWADSSKKGRKISAIAEGFRDLLKAAELKSSL